MITTNELELSSMSYTSKDFGALYPELLDLAKRLTNSWNPATSNESDPGVVLLKEAAFIGDHNNYNIDKNILENFLPSATQDKSVRNICEMNGYVPRYYISATGDVSFKYTFSDDEPVRQFTIPRFTITVTNADKTVTYTQAEDLTILVDDEIVSSGDSSIWCSCKFIEGTIQTVTVNDSSVITLANLDDNNRLYLPEVAIAQNGVYVNYANESLTEDWVQDNYALTKPLGTRVYKLDYDSDVGLPYLEFPSDIASLINDGLTVRYISTSGAYGNIEYGALTSIAGPSNIVENDYTHASDQFEVKNTTSFLNGKDPETIDEMYQSFKKTVGTFESLVSCLDYSNYIYQLMKNDSPLVSNVYVTDRRSDYNKSLNVVTYDSYGTYKENLSLKQNNSHIKYHATIPAAPVDGDCWVDNNKLIIRINGVNKDASVIDITEFTTLTEAMTPFDLAIYALSAYLVQDYSINDKSRALNNSFKPASTTTLRTIKSSIEDVKCLSHTYKDPTTDDIFCFKNFAPLSISIKPYSRVSKTAGDEIINNICKSISDNYNARMVEFGENIDTTKLKEIIIASDSRIRDVDLQPINYKTYAMKANGSEVELMTNTTLLIDLIAKNVLAGRVCLFNIDNSFKYEFGQSEGSIHKVNSISSELSVNITPNAVANVDNSKTTTSRYSITSDGSNISYYLSAPSRGAGMSTAYRELQYGDIFQLGESTVDGTKIYDTFVIKYTENNKVVLNTYQYVPDMSTTYKISFIPDELVSGSLNNVEYEPKEEKRQFTSLNTKGRLIIEISSVDSSTDSTDVNLDNYVLKDNENIQIIYPNYYSDKTYSVYVNYRFISTNPAAKIRANEEHVLKDDEKLVLQYTNEGTTYTDIINPKEIVKSSFDISVTDSLASSGVRKTWVDDNGISHNNEVFRTLTSNQTISTRVQLSTTLNNSNIICYWIVDENLAHEHRLFEKGATTKILGPSEYFIYANVNSNNSLLDIMILGAGTRLDRTGSNISSEDALDIWLNTEAGISIETISTYGSSASISWKKINFKRYPISITEMNTVSLSKGDKLTITGWSKYKLVNDSSLSAVTADTKLNNDWKLCNGNIIYNDTTLPATNSDFYYIRSRLDISTSSTDSQFLEFDQKAVQKVKINDVTYTSGTDSATNVKLLSSRSIYLIGSSNIDLSLYEDFTIYKFVEKEFNGKLGITTLEYTDDPEKGYSSSGSDSGVQYRDYLMEYPFYCNLNSGESVIIPVYVKGEEVDITAKISVNNSPQTITDYNYSEPNTSIAMKNNIYFITYTAQSSMSLEAKLQLSWRIKSTQAELDEYFIINGFKVIKGFNDKLKIKLTDSSVEGSLGKSLKDRLKELISNSDKPFTKFYYLYEPSDDELIDLDRYCVSSSVVENNSTTTNYDMLAFDNPLIMFDKNNVACDKTIVQLDIGNSTISIQNSMLS